MPIVRARQAGGAPVEATDGRLSSLRVALDATPLLGSRSGVGVFATYALGALAARADVDVVAFAVSWRRRRGIAEFLPPGVTVLDLPIPARPAHLAWRWLPSPAIEWWTGRLDVVHGTNFIVPPARHAARVVTVHDLTIVRFPQLCQPATRHFPDMVRRAVERGAFVHTPSQFVAHEVIEFSGADPDRVRAVHHGVPPVESPIDPDATPDPTHPQPFILAIGTVEPRKDYPTLIRAFDALAASRPQLRLVIVGGDGWGADAVEAALAQAHHRDRVMRRGWVSNSQRDALLRAAAVLAYPSIYEGFGLPPLEAMSVGVPVVATRAGALPEILGDGAELVPVGDADALGSALGRVLDDEAARSALVARGRRRAAGFTWQACAEGLTELYRTAHGAGR